MSKALWRFVAAAWGLALLGAGSVPVEADVIAADSFHVIAHRGASGHAPENTLPAFTRAIELGAVEVELDVRMSRDGVLFLFHDRKLDEKTGGTGPFVDADSRILRELEIGSWFDRQHPGAMPRYAGTKLITLRELFVHFGARLFYHVEIKGEDPRIPPEVVGLLREFDLAMRVVVTSFSTRSLARVRELDSKLPLCWLMPREANLPPGTTGQTLLERQGIALESVDSLGLAQIGVAASDISPEIVALGRAAGLNVRGWGVKNDADIARVLASGASGMTLDWPERLIRDSPAN